jgi:hypothetical protein
MRLVCTPETEKTVLLKLIPMSNGSVVLRVEEGANQKDILRFTSNGTAIRLVGAKIGDFSFDADGRLLFHDSPSAILTSGVEEDDEDDDDDMELDE